MFKVELSIALATALLLGSVAAFAEGNERGERRRPGKPPQAAFDACASSTDNAVCSVQNRRGESMPGLCLNPPQLQTLVCVPDQHRRQRGSANDSSEGDSASRPRS